MSDEAEEYLGIWWNLRKYIINWYPRVVEY
jgi:hypothetical protein